MQTNREDPLIIVVADDQKVAADLKELLEFMDAPAVEVATVEKWKSQIGQRRLSAVFCAPCLDDEASQRVIGEVATVDPNVSIVVIDEI